MKIGKKLQGKTIEILRMRLYQSHILLIDFFSFRLWLVFSIKYIARNNVNRKLNNLYYCYNNYFYRNPKLSRLFPIPIKIKFNGDA